MKYKFILISILLGTLLLSSGTVLAQTGTLNQKTNVSLVMCGGHNPDGSAQTECKISDLVLTVVRIINFLLSWAWLVAIFYIMWAGYDMMFAGGNSEGIQTAKTKFSHAIIGFVLIMISYLLVNWIVGLFSGDGSHGVGVFEIYRNLLKP